MCPTNIEDVSDGCVNRMYRACNIVTYTIEYSVSYSRAGTSCCVVVTCNGCSNGCTSEDDTFVPVTCVSEEEEDAAVSNICVMLVF